MRGALLMLLASLGCLFAAALPAYAAEEAEAEVHLKLDLSPETIERGKEVFMNHCRLCHGLKYYRGEDFGSGIPPLMDPSTAADTFGAAPPDLSLMAAARGKGTEGAEYVYRLLNTYYTEDGVVKNRAFAEETQGEGVIAMPQPISQGDPELEEKSAAVSAFLYKVSDPSMDDRRSIGRYVLVYMVILTGVLYVLNRFTWKGVKKK